MGNLDRKHSGLVSGLKVTIVHVDENGAKPVEAGTLTGVARYPRGTSNKVLVTNRHAVTVGLSAGLPLYDSEGVAHPTPTPA